MTAHHPDTTTERDLEDFASQLEASGRFHVLRRLVVPSPAPMPADVFRRGLFVDVETTGLDATKDTVIEFAMVPFGYSVDGDINWVGSAYSALRDPGFPIPEGVSRLTGITDFAVKGKSVEDDRVEAAARECSIVVAHNSSFDRAFCEKLWPAFRQKPWACSLREIDWAGEGFEGTKLGQIAAGFGFYFDSHRAADDCHAGVEVLRRKLPRSGLTAFSTLLASARRTTMRISAYDTPFAARELLKERAYRWDPGSPGKTKCWFTECAEDGAAQEIAFLRERVYRRVRPVITSVKVTAHDRYSDRALSHPPRRSSEHHRLSEDQGKFRY